MVATRANAPPIARSITPIERAHFKPSCLRLLILWLSEFFRPCAAEGPVELDAVRDQLPSGRHELQLRDLARGQRREDRQEITQPGPVAISRGVERNASQAKLVFEVLDAKSLLTLEDQGPFDLRKGDQNGFGISLDELGDDRAFRVDLRPAEKPVENRNGDPCTGIPGEPVGCRKTVVRGFPRP